MPLLPFGGESVKSDGDLAISADEIKNFWQYKTNVAGIFGQKLRCLPSTSFALCRRLWAAAFQKGVKDRKINVETHAGFLQENFKRKANDSGDNFARAKFDLEIPNKNWEEKF